MQPKSRHTANRIALVSTPWPLYNCPSIQLGTLKAYLRSIFPDLQVDTQHVYLKLAEAIGYQQYHEISKRTWLAETVYAALLYPERFQQIEKLFKMRFSLFCLLKHPAVAGGNSHMCPTKPPRKCRDIPQAARFATLTSSGKAIVPKRHHR